LDYNNIHLCCFV